jgi:hypothetical protein
VVAFLTLHEKPDIELGVLQINDEAQIMRATKIVSIVTSAMLPASSMLVLYFATVRYRDWSLSSSTTLGSPSSPGVLANAWRVEIFAASMAHNPPFPNLANVPDRFAAVQIAVGQFMVLGGDFVLLHVFRCYR